MFAIQDPRQWVEDALHDELPKLARLLPKGAKRYVLLTNVQGSAHLDAGSIDTVQRYLDSTIPIPSQCLWRDDIARRLDNAAALRWAYPSLLTGGDLLALLFDNALLDDKERRLNAVRAFVREQHDRDQQVRFKQVELHNRLLDLFIDVPLVLRSGPKAKLRYPEYRLHDLRRRSERDDHGASEDTPVGAATALLNSELQQVLSKVVLEGAPGQGKSTVLQYVCQIHRRRILQETNEQEKIPEQHSDTAVRLPFKVDLRDFAMWLGKQNPFSAEETNEVPAGWIKSLEGFLAAQVSHYSGGVRFDVDDLHAVARTRPLLLAFDGLDEVADIQRRAEVVDEISRGVNRLTEIASSLQAVVTTRPAAFTNAPAFSDSHFFQCELTSISRALINEYATRWLSARKLYGREATEVRGILKDKLDQTHIRELSRNPMQLAILLSLIHTRGTSLPDKRTALYDAYVELFVSRESEKSAIVREHRDLLIELHRYLAWVLHAGAESSSGRGSVSAEHLRRLVMEYLADQGFNTDWAEELFSGMIERVVALVSRIEGFYEFEVQPLREYFAARHLYETAPYSPTGSERNGTLPDRFAAIARNFYWMNVTRFYAGCYNKGELPSLVECLTELANDAAFKHTRHPQELIATLLSDWVFSQHPKAMGQLVSLLLDGSGLRHMLGSSSRRARRQATVVLPKGCGNEELLSRCFVALDSHPTDDYASILTDVIKENAERHDILARWQGYVTGREGKQLTRWIGFGQQLGVLALLGRSDIEVLLAESPDDLRRVSHLVNGGQRSYFESDPEQFERVCDGILDGDIRLTTPAWRGSNVFSRLHYSVESFGLSAVLSNKSETTPAYYFAFGTTESPEATAQTVPRANKSVMWDRVDQLFSVFELEIAKPAAYWANDLSPWDKVVEQGRTLFGDRWSFAVCANVAAGIRTRGDRCEEEDDLFDVSRSLCRRARHARLRAGSASWWSQQFERALDPWDRRLCLLVFLSWAGPEAVKRLIVQAASFIDELGDRDWRLLSRAVRRTVADTRRGQEGTVPIIKTEFPKVLSERAAVLLGHRASEAGRRQIYQQWLANYDGDDMVVHRFAQEVGRRMMLDSSDDWKRGLDVIARTYKKGATTGLFFPHMFVRQMASEPLSRELVTEVLAAPELYPSDIVAAAELWMRHRAAEKAKPVAVIAEENGWFAQ